MTFSPVLITAATWLAYFFIYAFFGWVLEVIYRTVTTGRPVNSGFLAGAVCPIYGFGALGMLGASEIVPPHPAAIFAASALTGALLELVGGWAMEKLFNRRWWDYSTEPFNIGGYVCLKFTLAWGVIGLLFIDMIHPPVADFVRWLPPLALLISVAFCALAMIIDTAATATSVLKFNRELRELQAASDRMRAGSTALSRTIGTHALEAQKDLDSAKLRLSSDHERNQQRREELRSRLDFTTRRHLRAFPELRSVRYPAQLEEFRQALHELPAKNDHDSSHTDN